MLKLLVIAPPDEAARVRNALESLPMGANTRFVATAEAGFDALRQQLWDAIVVALPDDALDRSCPVGTYLGLAQGAPLVVIAGGIGEDAAAELIRNGARDVVSYSRMMRLSSILEHEIRAKSTKLAEEQSLPARKTETAGILAQGMAHDLNNIFTAMLCHVDILRNDLNRHPVGGEMPEIAFELRTLVQRGADLVRQASSLSRAPQQRVSMAAEKADDESNPKSGTPRGNGEHVFLVDDEEGLARIFGRLLQGLGYRVTVQTQASRALELFEKDPALYHVAIIDLHMPPPGGLGVAKRLHQLRPDLPIFIMSGYSDALGDSPPEESGVVGILQKPVTRETLATELRKALDRSAAL